jgi:hypothetical protein
VSHTGLTYDKYANLVPDVGKYGCIINKKYGGGRGNPARSYLDFYIIYVAGFPRTIEQAKQLNAKQKFDIVINLDVPFSEIKRRVEVCSMKLLLEIYCLLGNCNNSELKVALASKFSYFLKMLLKLYSDRLVLKIFVPMLYSS